MVLEKLGKKVRSWDEHLVLVLLFRVSSLIFVTLTLIGFFLEYPYNNIPVNTPFSRSELLNNDSTDVIWGTLRPGQYLGLRTKEPKNRGSVSSGLMWYENEKALIKGSDAIRYDCEKRETIKYGYVEHNARNYGFQVIQELNEENTKEVEYSINTTFLRPEENNKHDWTVRVAYANNKETKRDISFVWYTIIDPGDDINAISKHDYELEVIKKVPGSSTVAIIEGLTPSLKDFEMSVIINNDSAEDIQSSMHVSIGRTRCVSMADIKSCLIKGTMVVEHNNNKRLYLDEGKRTAEFKNLVAVQITLSSQNAAFDIVYQQRSILHSLLTQEKFTRNVSAYSTQFREKFDHTFKLNKNSQKHIEFARSAFSQMASSLGYVYGNIDVRDENGEELHYWRYGLFISVPNRAQFHQGFYWSESNHCALLAKWDPDLALEIVSHWLDSMNDRGWMPTIQILGSETIMREADDSDGIDYSSTTNTPALLLTMESILDELQKSEPKIKRQNLLRKMWPRLKAWYSYVNDSSYTGEAYRWEGRNKHLRKYCYMAHGAQVMYKLGKYLLLERVEVEKYRAFREKLVTQLNHAHWNEASKVYTDFSLPDSELLADEWKYIGVYVYGYDSLFPLLMKVVPTEENLNAIFDLIEYDLSTAGCGLKHQNIYNLNNSAREISVSRDTIWINIQYLTLRALKYYMGKDNDIFYTDNRINLSTTTRNRCRLLYNKLRKEFIICVYGEWRKTGHIWERYVEDLDGFCEKSEKSCNKNIKTSLPFKGTGAKSYTDWAALLMYTMAQVY